MTALIAVVAVALDALLGEPRRAHPLVGFGRLARYWEGRLYGPEGLDPRRRRSNGLKALSVTVGPLVVIAALLAAIPLFGVLFELLLLYLAIGGRSLADHARAVAEALEAGDLEGARRAVGRIVSRDTSALDARGVSAATVESVLENGNDALFGALFWFLVAGAPGVVLYRLVNTLDAMWGYRDDRYRDFGWAAARLDDLLNYLPARLTALGYALCGDWNGAVECWRRQGGRWKSPNAGPVMAAGAGALGVELGGPALYGGTPQVRPPLGRGRPPEAADIGRAVALVRRTLWLWLALIVVVEVAT